MVSEKFKLSGFETVFAEVVSQAEAFDLVAQAVETTTNGLVIASALQAGFPIIYASEAFRSFTGYSAGEILGQNCRFLQGPGTDPKTVEAIRDALHAGRAFRGEILNYRKNGEPFWNLLRIEPLFNEDKLEYFVGVQTDITAQKHAEQSLRQYESIFNSSSDLMSLVSKDFKYLAVNQAYLDSYGKTKEAIVGHYINELHGDALFFKQKPTLECAFAGESVQVQHWINPPGQAPRYIDVKVTPYEDEASNVQGAVVSTRDITTLKKIEETLEQYQVILSLSSDLMALVDTEYHYLAVNDAYVKKFGKAREEILGKQIEETHGPAFELYIKPLLDRCLAGETIHDQHWIYPPKGEPRFLDVEQVPYRDADGAIIGAVVSTRDITDLKKAEQALGQANAIIAQSSDRISIINTDYHYRFTNVRNLEYYGKDTHEIIGKDIAEIIGQERFKDHTQGYLDLCFKGERVNYQTWSPKGEYLDILMEPYSEADGQISGAIVTLRDITHKRRAQEALAKSEIRFRDFAEIAADFLWETDADLCFTYLSEQQERITSYPAQRWLEQSYLDYLEVLVEDESIRKLHRQSLLENLSIDVELPLKRPDGTIRMVRTVAKPTFDSQGDFKGYRGIGRDVTEAHLLTQQLEYQATYDGLTGLVNRQTFDRRLEGALHKAKDKQQHHVLCYIDLDQFKIVNDTVGHAAGDELLQQVSALLQSNIRSSDTLARLGGDEFGLLLENCPLNKGITIAEKMVADLRDYSFCWQDRRFKIGASIGVVAVNPESESSVQLMSQADVACYAAKDGGRNRVHVYQTDSSHLSEQHAELMRVSDIRSALQEDRFCLYYQYITPLNSAGGLAPYYELLLRLKDERGKLVSPGAFIPAAERYNLMNEIDRWVIRTALVEQQDLFAQLNQGYIAINLSGTSLNDETLLAFVKEQFAQSRLVPERICFEITETAVIRNLSEALTFINAMRELGCKFALDDFGSGLSSFAYLKRFNVDFLKIDGNLVRDMTVDYTDQVMVSAINEIGHAMNISTIAEFVETEDDITLLKTLQVDYAQGFAISRPEPLETLTKFFRKDGVISRR